MDSEENTEPNLSSVGKDETVSNENIEPSKVTVTEPAPSVVSDMLDAALVKTSEQFKFNFQIGKNSKKMSEEEISKISEMVAGLAKYNDCEEEFPDSNLKIPSKQKKGKSPRKSQGIQESSSLSQFIDSELASLHPSDGGDKNDRSQAKDDKKPHKTGVHVASVSAEKQLQFESMLKEDLVSATVGVEELNISTGAQPKVKVETETVDTQQTKSVSNQQKQKEEQIKGSPKKKGEKKSPKKKGNQGQSQAGNQELGSYSQLLISMGKRSPQRRIEIVEDMNDTDQNTDQFLGKAKGQKTEGMQPQGEGQGKKKKNKKQKGNQQAGPLQHQNVEEEKMDRPQSAKKGGNRERPLSASSDADKGRLTPSNIEQAQSAGKGKKKGKGSPKPTQDKDIQIDRPPSAQGSNKQKKKNRQGSQDSADKFQPGNDRPVSANKQKSGQPAYIRQGRPEQRQQHVPVTDTTDSYTEMTVRVPKPEHMYIIGPQSRHLHEIMMVTGVAVSVPPLNSQGDEIVLRGDKMQLGPAVAMMFSKSQLAQNEAYARMGMPVSPLVQGQSQYQNAKAGGQGHIQQGQKGQGNRKREFQRESQYECDDKNFSINVNFTQNTKDHKVQHERHVTSAHQGHHQQQGHHQHHQHHVISTPVHPSQRPVKGQHLHPHGQQGQGKHMQGQGHLHQQDQGLVKSQGRRQRKKKNLYADYLPIEEVSQGLKRGILVEGPIRINPKNFEEAYVPHPDGKSDILICGTKSRNRALNGDIVAVQLSDEGDWKFNKQELEDLENTVTGEKNGGSSQDSDPEVVIESEEIVEITGTKGNNQTEASKGGNQNDKSQIEKKGNRSPAKRYTSLSDMMTGQSPARHKLQTEEGRDEIKKLLQRTGKVVAIIERKHSRACTGFIKPMQDKSVERALFSPIDHRIPRIMIPTDNCPKDFLERPDDYGKTLYVCRITDWKQDSFYAEGCLAKSLGEAGEIEPETEGMLIENGVDFDDFPQEALDCLPQESPWQIPEEEFEYRKDFRSSCVFTIDPATARDLDDAVSCEDLGDGRFRVGVHIADVSYFLEENSVLDRVAALRSTSVYLVHKVIPMLPRLLCEQLCSLNPDVDRLTFSVEWVITGEGEIEEEWFGRSVIRSCAKLAYDHAQGFIEEPERNWTQEELPPISEGFTVDDIKSRVLNLQKIAVNLRKARMDGGALRLDQLKLQYSLDADSGLPNGYWVYEQRDSNRLIEEFMLLANMAVADKINREFPDKALLRRHPPPQEKMVENLRDQCSALGIHIDTSSAGAIQRSLRSYCGDDDDSKARMQVLVALCSKPMQNAKYFCTGCIDDESLYHHYALNVPLYTHFTSPIRRYPDVLVHRLLGASFGYIREPSRSPGEIQKLADHSNDKKTAAKRVGELSSELFFSVFVKTAGPLEEKAMVMGVLDKAFDIFVLKLGVTKRVYCDKLPIKEKIFKRERKVPSLVLVWNSEGDEPEIRQEITIFSSVDCILEEGEQPLQWTAVIKRPQPLQCT
ncbi:DIS3-like exonuclease 2 isoform X2 [Mercenaria mercenaria]|uniref:DIS3-like exonuclease 2 isoform X2 n=1 Tax=Mercenaria mercenaria TaxID=6596 RepID=UPI00234F5811|nr:DIS3-like exonuclease 2 isoform X2 [Mercenaria mercenaria]